jgi:tRNA A-37 threonylcarbamoyl transferase component Bud32
MQKNSLVDEVVNVSPESGAISLLTIISYAYLMIEGWNTNGYLAKLCYFKPKKTIENGVVEGEVNVEDLENFSCLQLFKTLKERHGDDIILTHSTWPTSSNEIKSLLDIIELEELGSPKLQTSSKDKMEAASIWAFEKLAAINIKINSNDNSCCFLPTWLAAPKNRNLIESHKTAATKPTIALEQKIGHTLASITIGQGEITYEQSGRNKTILGHGAFGNVYKGFYGSNDVAIKEFRNENLSGDAIQEIRNEAIIANSLKCEFIVKSYGLCEEPYALIMEYMNGNSLFNLLSSKEDFPWNSCYQICLDISKGLKFVHDRDVIHGDLKTSNILLTTKNRAKIADFGGSKLRKPATNSLADSITLFGRRVGGTPNYLAPELLAETIAVDNQILGFTPEAKTTKATDMYSFGLVLTATTTRLEPFVAEMRQIQQGKLKCSEFKDKIITDSLRAKQNPNTPKLFAEVIEQSLFGNYSKRIAIKTAVQKIKKGMQELPKTFSESMILKS